MRYTVLLSTKRGANRVKPGKARPESHALRPTPRRLRVFCSTADMTWLPPLKVDHRIVLRSPSRAGQTGPRSQEGCPFPWRLMRDAPLLDFSCDDWEAGNTFRIGPRPTHRLHGEPATDHEPDDFVPVFTFAR